MRWIFLIFIVMPVLEMIVLIEVGKVLGSLTTVALVFITAILGVMMLRQQGFNTLLSFNQKLNSGELPAQELLAAVLLLLAGVFLLAPGFVTDTLGFLLLIPFIRHALADYLVKQGMLKAVSGFEQSQFYQFFEEQTSGNTYEAEQEQASANTPKNEKPDLLE